MILEFNLKLSAFSDIKDDILTALRDGSYHNVKMSTNKKIIEPDRKDARLIGSLKNIKIFIKKQMEGY